LVLTFISGEQISQVRKSLTERFSHAKTIPGTRSFHQFVPLDDNTIRAKRVSEDEAFSLTFQFRKINAARVQPAQLTIKTSNFVICKYDDCNWVGIVTDVDVKRRCTSTIHASPLSK
jgi:hypothetical protein